MPSCLRCGRDNPEGFRFCGACGAPLGAADGPAGEERKLVTVLFCDLVGFTARSDRADPEDVGAMLRPYHRRFRAEIHRFGGTLDKLIGDGVMAVFGVPLAHEDDPERAVRCALRMLTAIDELNQAHPTLDLAVRIGIATGEALVALNPAEGAEGVVGDVVNTASRLQGVAPVGGIVVEEGTWRATRALFDHQALAPVRVKGKAEPVAIWRVAAARSRTGLDAGSRPTTPFVGRAHELELLRQLYRRVVHERSVQLVTIVGEPGVGKSRLVGELAAFVDARPELVDWRQGRCLPYGDGITFWALGEIVKAQADILESDGPAVVAAKLEGTLAALFDDPSQRAWCKARLAPLVGLATAEAAAVEQSESFSAWRQLIEAIAASHPLVLVVEDLHWADPALLEFVRHLVDWAGDDAALLVVATARPELLERHPGWGGGMRNSATVSLPPLTDEETARLVAALLGLPLLPAEVQAVLLERAGGNPLYAEELVRLLRDRGLLSGEGRLRAAGELPLPATLQALIAARLDALTPERKALLQDAAVAGKVFWSGALAAMGGSGEAEVRAALRELQRTELIRAVKVSSVERQAEYSFWHALVRDVAYAQIPRGGRARRHRAVADWLQELAGDRAADRAELIAYHYTQALALTHSAGGAPEQVAELEESARRFLALAGDRAVELDPARARTLYDQVLELAPADDPDRPRLLVKAASAAFQAGEHASSRARFEAAAAGFLEQRDRLAAGDVLASLAGVFWNLGDAAASRARLQEAIELLEAEPAGAQLGHAYAELAAHRIDAGRFEEALVAAERGLALIGEQGTVEQRLGPLGYRGTARGALGDPGGLDDLRQALALALDAGLSYQAGHWYANLALQLGDVDPAASLASYSEGIGFARRRGLTELAMWMRAGALERLFELGRWDELLAEAAEVVAWYQANGPESFAIGAAEVQRARVLAYRGQLRAADELVQRYLPAADVPFADRLMTLTVAAVVKQAADDPVAAVRQVEELQRASGDRPGLGRARLLPELVRVCVAADRLPLARRLLAGLAPATARVELERRALLTAEAALAESRRDLEEAAAGYEQAAEAWAAAGHILEQAQALLGLGRCRRRLGRAGGGASLRAARVLLGDLGCRPLLEETEAWLRSGAAGSG